MSDSDGPEPAGLEGLPPIFSIAKGEVVSVQTYGAFVRLPGYKKEGLRPEPKVMQSECRGCRNQEAVVIPNIHHKGSVSVFISAVSARVRRGDCKAPKLHDAIRIRFQHYRRNPSLIAETGLTAVILFVSFEGRLKIDSIPHYYMTQYITDNADRQDSRRRRQFRDHTGNRITLEAVLNTTCSKCGCKGHFTKDCFSAPGLQYALLPEEDDAEPQQQQQQPSTVSQQQDSDKKKKKKKEKKMKKKRKRERKESDSDSSSGSSECKSKRRHLQSNLRRGWQKVSWIVLQPFTSSP
ncbi:Nucleolar protein of 40 kDa [Larimichthys crocea]|uniref:Uncharacterized protein n=1 Tax=Larimichthys crocea TaxID=215358 RepID=A0ACD3RFL4_LARCR|nr:Nucleolar protein of 40 kDa [Larimichthys crocea]